MLTTVACGSSCARGVQGTGGLGGYEGRRERSHKTLPESLSGQIMDIQKIGGYVCMRYYMDSSQKSRSKGKQKTISESLKQVQLLPFDCVLECTRSFGVVACKVRVRIERT